MVAEILHFQVGNLYCVDDDDDEKLGNPVVHVSKTWVLTNEPL